MKASTLRNGLFAAALVGGLGLASGAQAQVDFTVNPSAISEPFSAFTATFIQFGYTGYVDQTVVGPLGGGNDTFVETGYASFSNFSLTTPSGTIDGAVSGLGDSTGYRLYSLFVATGTVAPNGAGTGLDITFTNFQMEIWADPNRDTPTTPAIDTSDVSAPDQNGFTGHAGGVGANSIFPQAGGSANFTFAATDTDDDVMVAKSGLFLTGNAHAFADTPGGQIANGDFDVIVQLLPTDLNTIGNTSDDFFTFPLVIGFTVYADFNGVNTTLNGILPTSFTDGQIIGSGNMSLILVPEPSAISLLGLSLIGLGALARRRRRA